MATDESAARQQDEIVRWRTEDDVTSGADSGRSYSGGARGKRELASVSLTLTPACGNPT